MSQRKSGLDRPGRERLMEWLQPKTLRGRMIAIVNFVLIFTMAAILATGLFYVAREEYQTWQRMQEDIARSSDIAVEGFLNNIHDTLVWGGLFAEDEIRHSDSVLQLILEKSPAFQEITYLQTDGKILANASNGQELLSNPVTITQSAWFNQAIAGKTYYSPAQISPDAEPYIVISTPTLTGLVIATRISLFVLWDIIDNLHYGQFSQSYIINNDGILIAHTDHNLILESKKFPDEKAFQKILAQPGYQWYGLMRNFSGAYVIYSTSQVGNTNWIIVTETPLAQAFSSTITVTWLLPIFLFVYTLIAIRVINQMLARLFLEPVSRLHEGAEQIGSGMLNFRISPVQQDELGEVMESFNQMAEKLDSQHKALGSELLERQRAEEALRLLNEELETRVQQRTLQLSTSLAEKEVLIKEVHHRVKNNLQIISSLITLQSRNISDPQSLSAFTDSQNRIRSIALIHEKLYSSRSLEKIDFSGYIQSLAETLIDSYRGMTSNIKLSVKADPINLDLNQAVLCGLIINEIVSNSLKYAFQDQQTGLICIGIRQQPDALVYLVISDNGVGLPIDLEIKNLNTLGLKLVTSLVDQLNGELNIRRNNGTEFTITFYNQLG